MPTKIKSTLLRILATTLALTGTVGTASAALLAYEGFDYTVDGNLADGSLNGGSGFTSGWGVGGASVSTVASGSLNYPASINFTSTGNSASYVTTGEFFAQIARGLDAPAALASTSAGTRYISFLMNTSNLGQYNQIGIGVGGSYITFGFNENQFRMEVAGGGPDIKFGTPSTNTTYLFVAKIVNDGTNSVASLNVFAPGDSVSGTEGSWQATTSAFSSISLSGIYGFQGQNSTRLIDEIRIGENYADVVSVPSITALQSWRQLKFGSPDNSADGADGADPDGDGRSNLIEYALGSEPNTADSAAVLTLGPSVNSKLTITFNRVADPVLTYTVRASNDLTASWVTSGTTVFTSTGGDNTAGSVTVEDSDLISANPRRFLRLEVSY